MADERTPLLSEPVSIEHAVTRNPGIAASVSITTPAVQEVIRDVSDVEGDASSGRSADEEEDDDRPLVEGVRLGLILPGLLIGVFLSAADATIVVASYGRIGSEFKSLAKASWVATAFLSATTVTQPLYGKLSDLYGRKACLLFAYTVFALGSLWCGLARSMGELIIARALTGVGGGGMTTLVSILLSDVVSLRRRGAWQGYINLVYAAGSASGAPLGGLFADMGKNGWRWAFLGQVPLALLALICVSIFLNMPPRHTQQSLSRKFYRIDFVGAITLVCAVLCILVGLDFAGSSVTRERSRTATLFALPLGLVLFALFWVVEAKVAVEPFAPMRIVTDRSLLACYLCNLLQFACLFGILFFVPLYFQAVGGLNAADSGKRLVFAILGSVTGSVFAGLCMQKTGKYWYLTVFAYIALVIGCITILFGTGLLGNRSFSLIECGLAINGVGGGIGVTSTLIAMIARASVEDQAVTTAVSYLFRSLGSVLGVSIASFILQIVLRTTLRKELKGRVDEGEIDGFVRKATESLDFLKKGVPDDIVKIIVSSYERAVRFPFAVSAALGVVCLLCSLFIKEEKLRK